MTKPDDETRELIESNREQLEEIAERDDLNINSVARRLLEAVDE